MKNTYEIEITGTVYDYTNVEEGDRRELASDTTSVVMDDEDQELFDGTGVAPWIVWAVHVIDTTTDAIHPSSSPIGDMAREHEWLSGSYTDPYEGDSKITETSVRLTGDWTDQDRAVVFKMITGKYRTA